MRGPWIDSRFVHSHDESSNNFGFGEIGFFEKLRAVPEKVSQK
jgi:hypothetical protein